MTMTISDLVDDLTRHMKALVAVIDGASLPRPDHDDYLSTGCYIDQHFEPYRGESPVLRELRQGSNHQVMEAITLENQISEIMLDLAATARTAIPASDRPKFAIKLEIVRSRNGRLRAEMQINDTYMTPKPASLSRVATAFAAHAQVPA